MRRALPDVALLLAGAMLAVVFGVVVAILLEPNPLVDYDVPYQVIDTGDLVPGGTLTYVVARCANDPLSADPLVVTTLRDLVSDETQARYSLTPGVRTVTHGCTDTERLTIGLPGAKLPAGRYHLEGTSTAEGRFKRATVYFETTSFQLQAPND